MSDIINFATIILAAVVHATLQLGLGSLLLLYHESTGKHVKSQTHRLVGSFIAGVGTIVLLLLGTACFIISTFCDGAIPQIAFSIIIGALAAFAIVMWFFYYRRGHTTELWLPKFIANFIDSRAKVTNNTTEAFSLGVLTSFGELPFIAILLLVAGNSILELSPGYQLLMVASYTIITLIPLIIFRFAIRSGRNVVDIQKWRVKNKLFLRIISGCGFLVLAAFVLVFKLVTIP